MIHFAVVFDKNYLLRALALHRSTQTFAPEAQIWFLCLDAESKQLIENLHLPKTTAKLVEEINDRELMAIRSTRQPNEFAMSSKAAWLWHLITAGYIAEDEILLFVDADILWYDQIGPALEYFKAHGSIGITHHKFSSAKAPLGETVGFYNSGLIFFKNNASARQAISRWREQCIEWCYLYPDRGRHGDQKYLDHWPTLYSGVCVMPQKGLNTGTWNLANFKVTQDKLGHFMIDDEPLICYHFHGLKIYLGQNGRIKAHPSTIHHPAIYRHYLSTLTEAYATIRTIAPEWQHGFAKRLDPARFIKQTLNYLWRTHFVL